MWVPGQALFLGGLRLRSQGEAFRWTLPIRDLLLLVSGALDLRTLASLVLGNTQSSGFVKSDPNPRVNEVTHIWA